ncbi:MAG TPA: type IV pilin protein [Steroidobacteraceae bacterium]|jgi:type IV pilus assembly protein PilE
MSKGFTLVELMITMVVAAILISVALPSYLYEVRKSRRTEAKTVLMDLAAREERYFNTNNAYSQTPSDLGYGAGAFPLIIGSGYYQVWACSPNSCVPNNNAAPSYGVYAKPFTTDQKKDLCQLFTIDNTGYQTATDPSCWQ